jgi:hypothetical protein
MGATDLTSYSVKIEEETTHDILIDLKGKISGS